MLYTPKQLRNLFVDLLANDCCIMPSSLWTTFQLEFTKDFLLDSVSNKDMAINLALEEIGSSLEEHGKCLYDFGLPHSLHHGSELTQECQRWNSLSNHL